MENINSFSYCGTFGYGFRCSLCGAPFLIERLSINELRIGIEKQKTNDINFSNALSHQIELAREKFKNFRGGYRLLLNILCIYALILLLL